MEEERERKRKKKYMIEEEKFKPQLSFGPQCIIPTHPLTTHNTSLLSWDSTWHS